MAFQINNRILREYLERLGGTVATGTVRLFGVRGAVPEGRDMLSREGDEPDRWNDTIGIWGAEWALFPATVDPGRYFTDHPLNPDGAAHLLGVEETGGRPWRFEWGMHRGRYEALVQAEPFRVRRDRDRDGLPDADEKIDTGDFGIHIHWGGDGPTVGRWSAGCQVLRGGDGQDSPWTRFKAILKASKQSSFSYSLIDGASLAKHVGE